jgi:hypothetical protein
VHLVRWVRALASDLHAAGQLFRARRTDLDREARKLTAGSVYPPMDPADPLGFHTGDCGPMNPNDFLYRTPENRKRTRDAMHRCTNGCNPGNCPREDF